MKSVYAFFIAALFLTACTTSNNSSSVAAAQVNVDAGVDAGADNANPISRGQKIP